MAESFSNSQALQLRRLAAYRGVRVLTWDGDLLYACRGYIPDGRGLWQGLTRLNYGDKAVVRMGTQYSVSHSA